MILSLNRKMQLVTVRNKKKIIIGILTGIIILLFILPVRFPYTITASGKLLPARIWLLERLSDGSLTATFTDQRSNVLLNYATYQIERGDVLLFNINKGLINSTHINVGDTIGQIGSNQTEMEISQLRGELASARAMLRVNLSGEKAAVIRQAQEQLALSTEKAELQKKILERQQELFERKLISKEEYEIEAGTAKIYELEATMARARKEALESGAKPEYLSFLQAEIDNKQKQLTVLEEKGKNFLLLSPLEGTFYPTLSNDTLIVIGDTLCTVLIALPQQLADEVRTGQFFSFTRAKNETTHSGKIIRINPLVRILNGSQYIICTGVLERTIAELPYNLIVTCAIAAEPRSLFEYVSQFLALILK
jgi:hypothetical protein